MYPLIPLGAILPEIILLIGGCLVLLLGQAGGERIRRSTPAVALGSLVVAILAMVLRPAPEAIELGSGLVYDGLAAFARNSTLVLGVVITLVAWFQARETERGEFWSMVLFSLLGLLLVGAAADLLVLFIAVELVSVPTYVLVALSRRNKRALEAGTKYFYLGAFSAALMAFGFSLLYGVGGTAHLPAASDRVMAALHESGTLAHGLASIGVVLAIGGLLFKIAAVPLHLYIADVYQGAASSVAGLLGFVPKFAGFLAILKILHLTGHWEASDAGIFWMLWIVSALSMTMGNVLALMQTNLKRMLAYSGIAHSGYMLVGVLIGPDSAQGVMGDGTAAVLYYAVVYGIANLAAFAVLGLLRIHGSPCETLRDVAGLLRRHPGLALVMALSMLTLMGLPPTAGFWGKVGLFGGALAGVASGVGPVRVDNWMIALVIIGVLNSALAAAYYLRAMAAVLLYENDEPAEAAPREAMHVGVAICGFLMLAFAFLPSMLLDPSRRATAGLRGELFDYGATVTAPDQGSRSASDGNAATNEQIEAQHAALLAEQLCRESASAKR